MTRLSALPFKDLTQAVIQDEVTDKELTRYVALLRKHWEDESKDVIPNHYPWHSRIATRELFTYATSQARLHGEAPLVRILTGTLPDFIYSNDKTYDVMRSFVEAGGHIQVLIWNNDVGKIGGERLQRLAETSQKISVRMSGTKEGGAELSHFIIVGDRAFRLESPHQEFDQTRITDFTPEAPAMICFNNRDLGKNIIEMFDAVWDVATPVCNELQTSYA